MKLIRAGSNQFTFRINRREKQFLVQIVQMYPLVPPTHHQLSKDNKDASHQENQQLLEEAVAEQRLANKERLKSMLEDSSRFQETAKALRFSLSSEEIERLLQTLNDVRVGAWLNLGEPGELDHSEINKDNTPYFVAMEIAGYFQTEFLAALGLPDSPQTDER